MQLINDGPDIPNELIHLQEEGNVVFFCGAGISAKFFPLFGDLVKIVFGNLHLEFLSSEKCDFENGFCDRALMSLIQRIPNGRTQLIKEIFNIFDKRITASDSLKTHQAILTLAKDQDGHIKIVTTNFDRLFDHAQKRNHISVQHYEAPFLPMPKKSQWDGIVYLHGKLPKRLDDKKPDNLVITSGDFGLAYLTERWASRFVSELFRNYSVCFLGYSVTDPIIRYMVDAINAERSRGESTHKLWAFASTNGLNVQSDKEKWLSIGIKPILFKTVDNSYRLLHKTIQKWGSLSESGIFSKERVVVENSSAAPQDSTAEENFKSQMLWAVSDKSGKPMERFSTARPAPLIEWYLDVFAKPTFSSDDFPAFDIPANARVSEDFKFSLLRRPFPATNLPELSLFSSPYDKNGWDHRMACAAQGLSRYLHDRKLIQWVINHGAHLTPSFKEVIKRKLQYYANLSPSQSSSSSPVQDPVPGKIETLIWNLIVTDRVQGANDDDFSDFWLRNRIHKQQFDIVTRQQLIKALAPKVKIRFDDHYDETIKSLQKTVHADIVFSQPDLKYIVRDVRQNPKWRSFLASLLPHLELLLLESFDLLRCFDQADSKDDLSFLFLPSIEEHSQNRDFYDIALLIELLRDSWLALNETDENKAKNRAENWLDFPYPVFKRLALFASTKSRRVNTDLLIEALTKDEGWWLWSIELKREVCRFLATCQKLSKQQRDNLEQAILQGPPRTMFSDNMTHERYQAIQEQDRWLYLSKLAGSKAGLSPASASVLSALSQQHPGWQISSNQGEEFSTWFSTSSDPDFEWPKYTGPRSHRVEDLCAWLKKPKDEDTDREWRRICICHPMHVLQAFASLHNEGIYPVNEWRTALSSWSSKFWAYRIWFLCHSVVLKLPRDPLTDTARDLALFVKSTQDQHKDIPVIAFCNCILSLQFSDQMPWRQDITGAINHPTGIAVLILIQHLFASHNLKDNSGLPSEISTAFEKITSQQASASSYGLLVLGMYLVSLFRIDPAWTARFMIPLLSWDKDPYTARLLWEGFLSSPRAHLPLIQEIKTQLLETARHYDDLNDGQHHYPSFLTFLALDQAYGLSKEELRIAFSILPCKALANALRFVLQWISSSKMPADQVWTKDLYPFFSEIWPNKSSSISEETSYLFVRILFNTGSALPKAWDLIKNYAGHVKYTSSFLDDLIKSNFINTNPLLILDILKTIISDQTSMGSDFKIVVDNLAKADPSIIKNSSYKKLATRTH